MDCISIVKMDIKQLRKTVKQKFPKTRVSTMNKTDLSAVLLGVNKPKTSNKVNIKKESSKQLLKRLTKEAKKFNKKIDKKEAIANKNITMSQLKKRPPKIPPALKKPTIPPPLRPPALPSKNTESFKKALASVKKSRTVKLQPTQVLAKLTKEYNKLYETYKKNKIKNGYKGRFLSPKSCNEGRANRSNNCDTIINQLFRIWVNGQNNITTRKSIKHLEIMIALIKVEIKKNNGKVTYEDLSPASKNKN